MKAISFNSMLAALAAASAALTFSTDGLASPSFGHVGGAAHMGMPGGGGFHGGAPRSFHGPSPRDPSPRPGPPLGAAQPEPGGDGRGLERFRGQSLDHFSQADRARWSEGGWRHGWRHGHLGWWWVVDGSWFFYDQPSYPYPDYVGSDEAYGDDSDDPWPYDSYYCQDPAGYYPTVQTCNVEWQPAAPQ